MLVCQAFRNQALVCYPRKKNKCKPYPELFVTFAVQSPMFGSARLTRVAGLARLAETGFARHVSLALRAYRAYLLIRRRR